MRRHSYAFLLLLLWGCTPAVPHPQAALARANQEFAGRDVNDFFIDYGSPVSSRKLNDGEKEYRWVSIEPGGLQNPAEVITYPGAHFGDMGGNGETISGYCEIRILTDRAERIEKLTLVYDSIGKYSGTRCGEIFSQPPT